MNQLDTEIIKIEEFEQTLEKDLTILSKKHTNYYEFLDNFNKFVNKVEKIEKIK